MVTSLKNAVFSNIRRGIILGAAFAALFISAPCFAQDLDLGKTLYDAGGCGNCHTNSKAKGPEAAGGAALKTPFGDFYAPNITLQRGNGIGGWSEADFIKAMREGISPKGRHYFPVFPYPSFTHMTDVDLKALWAYLKTIKPSSKKNREHEIGFPFNLNFGQSVWKSMFFTKGPYRPDPTKSDEWNRGAYLSIAVAHCAECHTPRNPMGALKSADWFKGAAEGEGPEGEAVPDITPDKEYGIGNWTIEEIVTYLKSGETPDGDFAGSLMADVVDEGTSSLSDEDLKAIAVYLKDPAPPK